MMGTVKTYFEERGFGFIAPEDGGKDIFVHLKAIKSGAARMRAGADVEYEEGFDREKRKRAIKVTVLN